VIVASTPSSCLGVSANAARPGRAAAQGFEGTVTMTIGSTFRGKTSEGTIKTATKGHRTVATLVMGPDAGPMAGLEVRTIADRKANTLTRLTALPAGTTLPPAITGGVDAKGIKLVEPLSDQSDLGGMSLNAKPDIRKLGTSQTIAGVSCDDYEVKEEKAALMRACITTELGEFALPISGRGMMGGRGSATPGWARAFGGKPGFPLKVWSSDGKVDLQVTAIDKTPVADSAFAIPEGYVTMPGRGGSVLKP
jgi:hypothetical protein